MSNNTPPPLPLVDPLTALKQAASLVLLDDDDEDDDEERPSATSALRHHSSRAATASSSNNVESGAAAAAIAAPLTLESSSSMFRLKETRLRAATSSGTAATAATSTTTATATSTSLNRQESLPGSFAIGGPSGSSHHDEDVSESRHESSGRLDHDWSTSPRSPMPSTIITTAKLVNSPSQFHDSANFNRGNHRGLDESERERIYKQALKTVTDQAVVASVVEQHHHVHHHFHSNDSDYDSGREHNGNYEDSNRQSLKRRRHRSRCFGLALLSSGLALVAISIGVLLHLVRSTQKNDAVDSNAPPVVPPIQMPTFPPLEQRHVAFESTEELYQAVDAYLAALVASASSMEELDNDLWTSTNTTSSDANDTSASRRPPPPRLDVPSSPVALKYGYPMGTWNVSLLSNFSRVFDAYRHNGLPFDSLRSSSSTDDDSASSDTSSSSASSVLAFVNEDLSGWDVSNAETLFAMFAGAHDFIGFGLDEWDVSRVTNFSYMFMDAHSLQANVSSWNTSAAVSMEGLFQDATSFNGDLSAWDVSRVTNLAHMLLGAVSFEGLGGLQDWNVSRVETLHSTFQYADSFLGDSIASWDVSRVTIFADMAWDAKVFDADLSRWNVGKATDMSFMLAAPSYTGRAGNGGSVSLTGWDTSRVENMWGIFKKASSFVGNISTWNVSAVLDLGRALSHCYEFNGDLSRWDTSGALFMEEMFLEASSFASDVSAWDTRHVEDMSSMFSFAGSFNSDLSMWDVSKVNNLTKMFYGAAAFNQSLCSWKALLDPQTDVLDMFQSTDCAVTNDPVVVNGSSFCAVCGNLS